MFLNKTNESCLFIHADLKNTKKLYNLWIMTIENETLFGLLDGSPMHIDLQVSPLSILILHAAQSHY